MPRRSFSANRTISDASISRVIARHGEWPSAPRLRRSGVCRNYGGDSKLFSGEVRMTAQKTMEFAAADGSPVRACDFGPEFEEERRYLTLPDLEPILPTSQEGMYFIES